MVEARAPVAPLLQYCFDAIELEIYHGRVRVDVHGPQRNDDQRDVSPRK
jgi:hypothetical protein